MVEMRTEIPDSTRSCQWLRGITLSAYSWLIKIVEMVQAGYTDSLPVDEILVAVIGTAIGSYLLYSFVRGLYRLFRYGGGGESEFQHQTTVVHHGRWTVYGQQPSFWAEKRQRFWRKKLMTSEEQQKHIEKVQKQERKKRAKAKQRGTSDNSKPDKDKIRDESKRRL